MTFTVRLAGPSATIANDIKQAISGIDPELPVFRIQPMQEWIDRALVGRRAPMLISAASARWRCFWPASASTACSRTA
jgi:hypothetical protein